MAGRTPLALLLMLAACATARYGRELTDADLARVEPGMSRDQVRELLGAPTHVTFEGQAETWVYLWSVSRARSFVFYADVITTGGSARLRFPDGRLESRPSIVATRS